jgi:hypothetical protein
MLSLSLKAVHLKISQIFKPPLEQSVSTLTNFDQLPSQPNYKQAVFQKFPFNAINIMHSSQSKTSSVS